MFNWRHFPSQENKETMQLLLRRHWAVRLWINLRLVLFALLPVAVYYFLQYFFADWQLNNLWYALAVLLASAYYIAIWLYWFNSWIDYYLDTWIVTNLKVISVEQRNLFNREIARMRLAEVQDVTSDTVGFFATVFHFGNVTVQSAGTNEHFVLEQVPNPTAVAQKILSLANDAKTAQGIVIHEDKTV